jgi:amidophosphoribosyltransferase
MEIIPEQPDRFHDECGLMGVWGHPESSNITYLGLYAQQHRGQEGAGVVCRDNEGKFNVHKGLGLVSDVFENFKFSNLPGNNAIGHVRYTTAGGNVLRNVQPFQSEVSIGQVAVAHNGNLINIDSLKESLISTGSIFTSTSDSEVILHLLARAPKSNGPRVESVIHALKQIKGAYSLLILVEDSLFAVRDPNGVRPLAIGKLNDSYIFASETCAFDLVGAEYVRDVNPGELVEVGSDGQLKSYSPFEYTKPSPCIFEYIYFARPDSKVFEQNVYSIRKKMGEQLAKEHPAPNADVVIPVPDSGVAAAMGFATAAGLPFELGLIRNHYVGRTFIEPSQTIRDFGVKLKLNPNPGVLSGKSVVVVDDSIVRGTTSRKLMNLIRKAGAKEIHLRISCPPTTDPCYYGIDTPSKNELIASTKTLEEIRDYVGVDSLGYLSMDGLYLSVNSTKGKFCDACFSGNYPLGTPSDYVTIGSRSKQASLL